MSTVRAAGVASFSRFIEAYPRYADTVSLDDLRARDYARLDRLGHAYLDYTGGSLYAESQIRAHAALLESRVLGNPHSANPCSSEMTVLVERARRAVLAFFGATADYTAVFTLNASGALKLVGEAYPFAADGRFLLTADNHNSVNGIREFAAARGARVEYVSLTVPELRIDRRRLEALLENRAETGAKLFAFPAQSNFSGVKHPMDLVDAAQANGWDVLLDAAAFVPTSRLDLSVVSPDFVSISFYKMFGYPTGVGCLLARKAALAKLRRPWYAGGTVDFATVQGRLHRLAAAEAGFEDGTLNYLAIPAVEVGLAHLERAGLETIQTRVACLTGWLLKALLDLRHSNGRPMIRLYGPTSTDARGGTVTLNFYDPDGHLLDYRRVEELAGAEDISLRTGCFCNPGAGETAEGLTEADMRAAVDSDQNMTLPRFLQFVQRRGGKSAGAIRVSLGIVSTFGDVERFVEFAARFRDQTTLIVGEAAFDIESCRILRDGS